MKQTNTRPKRKPTMSKKENFVVRQVILKKKYLKKKIVVRQVILKNQHKQINTGYLKKMFSFIFK